MRPPLGGMGNVVAYKLLYLNQDNLNYEGG
jgi:hypothetical protein